LGGKRQSVRLHVCGMHARDVPLQRPRRTRRLAKSSRAVARVNAEMGDRGTADGPRGPRIAGAGAPAYASALSAPPAARTFSAATPYAL
jgi:hypothetical protein